MIRSATPADIPRLVEMGLRFSTETVYKGRVPAVPEAITKTLDALFASGRGGIFVTELNGVVVAMIGMALYEHHFTGLLTAAELFWWVEPEHRGQGVRLLRRAEQWAAESGARVLQMIAPTPDVERLYERLGYGQLEVGYQKAIA